ncbi:MAG: hypothetical protein K1X51_15695 [Rhodospirillaceae bacterium]|nr:hypothetical protein [Rhodospirillaceae bacterium]
MSSVGTLPKITAVVLCDDARKEDSGKHILIGVYGTDISLEKIPSTIHLAVWIGGIFPVAGDYPFSLRAVGPDGKIAAKESVGVTLTGSYADEGFITALTGMPLNISSEGKYLVQWHLPEGEWETISFLRVAKRKAEKIIE